MHMHLPKPLHGWREFVGEVGIIVIGVLIALGAEQVLESWHWHRQANETVLAIKDELAGDYAQAVEAASVAPCVDRQLVDLEAALVKPDFTAVPAYTDSALNRFVVRTPSRPWADSAWKAATSEGTVSHLAADLRESLQAFYHQISVMELNARQVDVLSWRLRALALPATADQRGRAIQDIEELRGHIDYMALVANQLMGRADAINMRPSAEFIRPQMRSSGTAKFCQAHGIPLGRPDPTPPS
jgi:hypothetical protein